MSANKKPLMEQRDQFNQRLTFTLEERNGSMAMPQIYLRNLLKTQSLEAWNGRQGEFRDWIAEQMAAYYRNLEVKIYGWSN